MTEQTKFVLTEDRIPTHWVNLLPDLPGEPLPPLNPGHDAAGRPGRPHADLPDGDHRPGGVGGTGGRDPRGRARRLPAVAAHAAVPRAPARARARYAGAHLLQVRGRLAGRLAQAEQRGRAGVRQQGGGRAAAVHRDRRRPVGLGAGARVQPVRARVRRLHGRRELRPEAVPAGDDGELGRHGDPLARATRPRPAGARPSTPRARSASRSPRRWRWPRATRARTTRSARC